MTTRISTMDQVRAFVSGTQGVEFKVPDRHERRAWIGQSLMQLSYERLGKADKGMVVRYLCRITGYSRQQMSRLVRQWRDTGSLADRRGAPAKPFATRYSAEDVALLAEVDALHDTLSGPATKKLCERAWKRYGDGRYERLAAISVSHLYNLRRSRGYRQLRGRVDKTRPTQVRIGKRRAPRPQGRPGYVRVDSVHSGEWDGVKGLYVVNMVDEVTQYQHMAAVARLSENHLVPALERLLDAFPFTIRGFHADNGSEYVNHTVARLLDKLLVEFTKSRPRRSNDNGLVETKNGAVVRKHLGHAHIPSSQADALGELMSKHLCPYLNEHRPCFFPVTYTDAKGRQRKRYPYDQMMTPLDKLASLPGVQNDLKQGVTLDRLLQRAAAITDNEAAKQLNEARDRLYRTFTRNTGVA